MPSTRIVTIVNFIVTFSAFLFFVWKVLLLFYCSRYGDHGSECYILAMGPWFIGSVGRKGEWTEIESGPYQRPATPDRSCRCTTRSETGTLEVREFYPEMGLISSWSGKTGASFTHSTSCSVAHISFRKKTIPTYTIKWFYLWIPYNEWFWLSPNSVWYSKYIE